MNVWHVHDTVLICAKTTQFTCWFSQEMSLCMSLWRLLFERNVFLHGGNPAALGGNLKCQTEYPYHIGIRNLNARRVSKGKHPYLLGRKPTHYGLFKAQPPREKQYTHFYVQPCICRGDLCRVCACILEYFAVSTQYSIFSHPFFWSDFQLHLDLARD